MKYPKKRIIKVQEDEITITDLELDDNYLKFYKKETGRTHVTQKGLSKFINRLISLFHR